jgi:ABC-type multidrug transport system fused ATPase/permease subunit
MKKMINKIKNISITVLLIFVVVAVASHFINKAKIRKMEIREQERTQEIAKVNEDIETVKAQGIKKREAYRVEIKKALRLAENARSKRDNIKSLTRKEIKALRTKSQDLQGKYDILEADNINKQDKIDSFTQELDGFRVVVQLKDKIILDLRTELKGLYFTSIPKLNKIIADQKADINKFISDSKKKEIVFGPQGG